VILPPLVFPAFNLQSKHSQGKEGQERKVQLGSRNCIRVTRLGEFSLIWQLLRLQKSFVVDFLAFRLSFVVDIFGLFFDLATFWAIFEKFGNFFLSSGHPELHTQHVIFFVT
jgi:hypothetical protein